MVHLNILMLGSWVPGRFFYMSLFHFTGIKGSGMSSLAQVLHDSGATVQGSDMETYFFTEKPLRERNIRF